MQTNFPRKPAPVGATFSIDKINLLAEILQGAPHNVAVRALQILSQGTPVYPQQADTAASDE